MARGLPVPPGSAVGDARQSLGELPQCGRIRAIGSGRRHLGEAQRPALLVITSRPVVGTANRLQRRRRI